MHWPVSIRSLVAHHRPAEWDSAAGPLPLNTVGREEDELLRVVTRYDDEVHLARQAGPGEAARPALHPRGAVRDRRELSGYHRGLLAAPLWSPCTVCGETWWQMASHSIEVAMLATGRRLMCPTCAAMTRRKPHPVG